MSAFTAVAACLQPELATALEPPAAAPQGAEQATAETAEPGQGARASLRSTLDPRLGQAARQLLQSARPLEGAIVVLDPRSGKVLAWTELRRRGAPGSLITTAIAPAASVFKLVTTAALFENGGVQPLDKVCIAGGLRRVEREHLEAARGPDTICSPFAEALGHSRNAAFAQLATRRLLRSDLLEVAERLGFNASVPFDWPVPVGQLSLPYNDLEFARTAAGFQGSTLSPLGGAHLASIIAAGGISQRVRLLAPEPADRQAAAASRVLSATTAWRMTRMMEVTVHSGTCRSVFTDPTGKSYLPGIRVAGKTGTLRPYESPSTTSWFIGFAPSRKPEVVVSVMLQNGAVWRQRAAEVARDLLRFYFHSRGHRNVSDPFAGSQLKVGATVDADVPRSTALRANAASDMHGAAPSQTSPLAAHDAANR